MQYIYYIVLYTILYSMLYSPWAVYLDDVTVSHSLTPTRLILHD